MTRDAMALMDTLDGLMKEVVERLSALFPWVSSLNTADRREFAVELLQAVQARDMVPLIELLEDWQATAEALGNPRFIQSWQRSDHLDENIPWEQVRGELDLSHNPETGRP
jgi:hypothetical protein